VSKKDKKRWLRTLVCEGCYRQCRYRDFRAFGPHAGGFASREATLRDHHKEWLRKLERRQAKKEGRPLPHGNKGRKTISTGEFSEHRRSLLARREQALSEPGAPLRRGGVLGHMHETKRQMWQEYVNACPCWGQTEEDQQC